MVQTVSLQPPPSLISDTFSLVYLLLLTYWQKPFLITFIVPHQIQLQTGFVFPNSIPASLDSASVFFPGYLSLLSPSVCFLIMLQLFQELLVHPQASQNFWLTLCLLGWTILGLGRGDLWTSSFSAPLFPQCLNPMECFQADSWSKFSSSTGLHSCFLPVFPPQEPECHYLMVIASRADFELHISNKPSLVCMCEIHQSVSSCWLVCHLSQKVSLMLSKNILHCLCLAVLFLKQTPSTLPKHWFAPQSSPVSSQLAPQPTAGCMHFSCSLT